MGMFTRSMGRRILLLGGASLCLSAQNPEATWQNNQLVLRVQTAAIKSGKPTSWASVALALENRSDQEVFLSCASEHFVSLVDSLGNTWKCDKLVGIQRNGKGYNRPGSACGRETYSRLAPKAKVLVTAVFWCKGEVSTLGKTCQGSLAMDLFQFVGPGPGDYQAVSVGLAGIPLGR